MAHPAPSADRAEHPRDPDVVGVAAGRGERLLHRGDGLAPEGPGSPRAPAEVEPRPPEEVLDVRDEPAEGHVRARELPAGLPPRPPEDAGGSLRRGVRQRRAMRDGLVGRHQGLVEAERPEQEISERGCIRPPGHHLDHPSGDREPGVVVRPAAAGREELWHVGQTVHHSRERVVTLPHPRRVREEPVTDEARRVREEVADRDLLREPRGGQAERREVPSHRIVERELAALDQRHDRRRGERLADRADLEEGPLVDRQRVLEAGHAVAGRDLLGADPEAHRHAGHSGLGHGRRHARVQQRAEPAGSRPARLRREARRDRPTPRGRWPSGASRPFQSTAPRRSSRRTPRRSISKARPAIGGWDRYQWTPWIAAGPIGARMSVARNVSSGCAV